MIAAPRVKVAVIGAGFAGIGMAIECRRLGIDAFTVIDKADRPGGVWRDNTYPGAACDVPSHLYSFSFAQGGWTRRFSRQPEILAYLDRLVDRHSLREHLRLGTEVRGARWDEEGGEWELALSDGSSLRAAAMVSAVGQLNRPSYPSLPGRERFAGPAWHSASWDGTVDLHGRRVGVIGTGASAVQFVPFVAEEAASTVVFQRSAPYVLPRGDHAYEGREGAAFRLVPGLSRLDRLRTFLTGETLTAGYVASERLRHSVAAKCLAHLEAQVADPELRRICTPDYEVGCKRICFSDDWYPTLARPDVQVVTDRLVEITETGVRTADGAHHELDVLIYGTGFQASGFLQPMEVTGTAGTSLQDRWKDGAYAYLGVTVAGFPNFFMLYGPNTNLGANSIIYMLESQIGYVGQALQALGAARSITVRPEVERAFNQWVEGTSARTTYRSGCHSWYTTASGRNTNNWPTFTFRYRRRLRRLDPADFTMEPAR